MLKNKINFVYKKMGVGCGVRKIIRIFIDLDGTICGDNIWKGLYYNTRALFKTGLLSPYIPPNHSWKILTSRPKLDKFIINRVLHKYRLFPEDVIVSPTWFYRFDDKESVANWKSSILSREADSILVDKVIYVDNDSELLSKIIKHKNIILCKTDTLSKVLEELEE